MGELSELLQSLIERMRDPANDDEYPEVYVGPTQHRTPEELEPILWRAPK